MSMLVTAGAAMQCSFGLAPSVLNVLPDKCVLCNSKPVANIMDNKPMMNILPFGMCQSLANPQVAAATAAALGVLTPMPCIPVIPAPWAPGSLTVLVKGQPAVNNSCKLMCAYAGVIQFTFPGQANTMVP